MAPPQGAYAWTAAEISIQQGLNNNESSGITYPWLYLNKNLPGTSVWILKGTNAIPWPLEEYGEFYQDCVFLVLSTQQYGGSPTLNYDLYLWVGKSASLADYSSGAVRITELFKILEGKPTLHREVQGLESEYFNAIFNPIVYWRGTPERSYRYSKLKDNTYSVRMLQLYKPDVDNPHAIAKEVPCNIKELDPAYTFILDLGCTIYMWQGDLTKTEDDVQSIHFLEHLRASRGAGITTEVLNEEDLEGHSFFSYMSKDSYTREEEYGDEHGGSTLHRSSLLLGGSVKRKATRHCLIQIFYDPKTGSKKKRKSNPTILNQFEFRKVRDGKPTRKDLQEGNMFIYDSEEMLWVWFSKKTIAAERQMALQYAHDYLRNTTHPLIPVTVVLEEQPHPAFNTALRGSTTSQNQHRLSNGYV